MPRRPSVPDADAFWALVGQEAPEACWEWDGRRNEKGYGTLSFAGRFARAHRVAWELTYGPIPDGMVICHRCDNPPCCNPAHLFLGTQLENIADREAKGRGSVPPSRAKFTAGQVRQIRAEYERGLVTQQSLADRWGISRGNLSKILTRRLYTHV